MNFANFNVHGPDISFYQDADGTPQMVNFEKMKAAGASFVIVKAGQRFYVDPDFVHNWTEAKRVGLPRGSYWFYDSRETPKEQARKWWSLLESDPGELMHFLDLEENYNGTYRDWSYWYDCLYWFRDYSKSEKIGIYTGYYYWIERAPKNEASLQWFKQFPLWIASYNPQVLVKIPPPWIQCILWQYGTPAVGLEYGAESKEIDMNVFNGNMEAFSAYFGLGAIPPTEEGNNMNQWYSVNAAVLNIRTGWGASYEDIGDLLKGDKIETTGEPLGGWVKIVKIMRGAAYIALPGAESWCHSGYCSKIDPPATGPTLKHTIKVFSDGSIQVDNGAVIP